MLTNRFRFGALCWAVLVEAFGAPASAQNAPDAADVEIGAAPAPSPQPSADPSTPPEQPGPTTAAAPTAAPTAPTAAPTAPASATTPAPPPPVVPTAANQASSAPSEPFVELRGYAQVEYQSHQDSEEQLQQGSSTPLNQNRFLVRRGRFIARRAWQSRCN